MKFVGEVSSNKIRKDGTRYDFRRHPNLLVDDGKEYILDFFAGIKSWHSPSSTGSGAVGLMTFERKGAIGTCIFNNSSTERAAGTYGIATGSCAYPIASTLLVSPEDSTLSNEVGTRVTLTATRRDQTVEFVGTFQVPGNIPSGTKVREFGLFLGSSGPTGDPSFFDAQKPYSMLCRSVLWGSGYCGVTGVYADDPITANDDIELRWKFGEL